MLSDKIRFKAIHHLFTFVIGKMKLVSFSLFLDAPPPLDPRCLLDNDMSLLITYVKGILGLEGKASKNKLKDTSFIFQMTNVTILGAFRTYVQKEYGKVLEMKSTYILNILGLLFLPASL